MTHMIMSHSFSVQLFLYNKFIFLYFAQGCMTPSKYVYTVVYCLCTSL
jgi:hypothetical protein